MQNDSETNKLELIANEGIIEFFSHYKMFVFARQCAIYILIPRNVSQI